MRRKRPVNTHGIALRRRQELPTGDHDLELRLLLLIRQQAGAQIRHAPLEVLGEEGDDVRDVQVGDGLELAVADEVPAPRRCVEVVVEGGGDGDDVFDYDVLGLVLQAAGAGGVSVGGEDAGETDFVLLGHVPFRLVVFDVADE